MKKLTKILALALAVVMLLAMGAIALAAEEPSTPEIIITTTSVDGEAATDTTAYTWYRIFEADIEEDPTQSGATQSGGKVSYYVDSAAKAAAIESTGLFNVTQVGTTDKYYVELTDDSTTAEAIATEIAKLDLSIFPTGTFAQTAVAGSKTSGEVAPGYYYITSTAGMKTVLQTLTKVEIEEKNTFPTVDKAFKEGASANNSDWMFVQIGDDVTFTLTVEVPATANDTIVLTDTMSAGLTFKSIDSVKAGDADVAYTLDPTAPAAADKTFTITFAADDVIANQGKTITVEYTAFVNKDAVVFDPTNPGNYAPESNTAQLAYGNNYTSVPHTVTMASTLFRFDKVAGANSSTKLTGAEFQLTLDGETPIPLVEIEAGVTYRIAAPDDETTVTTIVTNGNTITILGVDSDVTYQLVETKAPTGYNKLEEPTSVSADSYSMLFKNVNVENNKGAVLPSTGGIGTTIFYVIGAVLVIGAGVALVARRRTDAVE